MVLKRENMIVVWALTISLGTFSFSSVAYWLKYLFCNTGKRLMAKCRLLYQENEELGKMISSGKLAKLEGDLALQRSFSEEMKKSQSELDEFLLELDEDVEGMQSTIYYLQQQLREAKEQIQKLQQDKKELSGLLNNSPANQRVVTDDNTDTECELVLTMDSVVQPDKENKSFHPRPLATINDISRTENMSNQTSDRGTNSGRPWSPPPVYEHRTEKTRAGDQEESVDETVDAEQLEKGVDDSQSSVEPPQSDIKETACDETNNGTSAGLTHVSMETENDDAQSSPLPEKTVTTVSDCTVEQSSGTEHKKTEKKQTTRKNAVDSAKRTAENGRGRKRTRPRSSVEQNAVENTRELPNPKRSRHKVNSDNQRTSIEIDTDTEVEVAQALALMATTAKQDRTDNSVNSQEPSDSLGNGELKESKTEAEA